jgi:hypothetical protein
MLLAAIYLFLAWFAAAALVACLLGRHFRAQSSSRYRLVTHSCGCASCDRPEHVLVAPVEAWSSSWTEPR